MNNILNFEKAISSALSNIGSNYPLIEIIAETLECKNDIVQEEIESGGSPDIDFWNFISDDIAAIFTVFEKSVFSVYVFKEQISNVVPILDELSMSETTELKIALQHHFKISEPTATLSRGMAEYWLTS